MSDQPNHPAAEATVPAAALLAVLDAGCVQRLRQLDPSGAHGLLQRVLDTFVDSLVKHDAEIASARGAGDRNALRQVAHTLKSSSASVGALALSRACADAESRLRESPPADDVSPLLDVMVAQLRQLLALVGRAPPSTT